MRVDTMAATRDLLVLFVYLIATGGAIGRAGRTPVRRRRVRARAASTVDPQPRSDARPKPAHHSSDHRRVVYSKRRSRPGPKGPGRELLDAVVAMKRQNPSWGFPRIARQVSLAFGIDIDKDVVRRLLSFHYRPEPGSGGPSWLTFLGHTKDSLWSCDLFRCESATLRTHWILVVMDQFTRRIIGFGVQCGTVDGVALCRMFQRAIRAHG